jgi:hypothetical protein
LLSITAPKHTAESILDRVYGVLSNARTSEFAVDLVSPEPLEPSVLEELGRMTNTVTRLDPSGKKVFGLLDFEAVYMSNNLLPLGCCHLDPRIRPR